MKKLFSVLVGLVVLCTSTAVAAVKLPLVKPPVAFTNEIVIREGGEVLYVVTAKKDGLSAEFVAGHNRRLRSVRLVMGDKTAYKWDCQYFDGNIDVEGEVENGVHSDNTVDLNRVEWLRFFERRVALPPFEFQPTIAGLSVKKCPIEFVGYSKLGCATFKVHGLIGDLWTLEERKFLIGYPRTGEFFLGMVHGKYLPLTKNSATDGWSVLMTGAPLVTDDFPVTD
jgi:hypothetical protein